MNTRLVKRRRSRAEAAADTRRRLLETARRLFLRDGFAETTLDRVAEAAGLTKGAVYGHFRSKADLFMSLEEAGLGLGPIAGSDPPPGLDWEDWVRHVARDIAAGSTTARELAAYLELLAMAIRNRSLRQRLTAQLRAQIDHNAEAMGQASPTPLQFPSRRFAEAAYGAVVGLAVLRALSPPLVPRQAFEDVLLGLGKHLAAE
jgi:AcrR family transcriptional regulator